MKFFLSHMKFAALRILPSMYPQNIEMYVVTMPVIYFFLILVKKIAETNTTFVQQKGPINL